MAQDFERYRAAATNAATLFTADSDDAIISIRIANITSGAVTADCFIYDGSSVNYYLVLYAQLLSLDLFFSLWG